ncbi:MAG: TonB-dependent receptor [Flavobacterium sp.]|nr:TonB-dependent receptor [Flavobacterium sp.]
MAGMWFLLLLTQLSFSQKKDENIGTEVVNVVKAYTPTISDAFKIKETPTLDDNETAKKEAVTYNIFPFPVASTFTPSKGKAAGVDKLPAEQFFKNYATLGFGNFGAVNAELFVTENISDSQYIGGAIRHLSSQGGIKNLEISDKFYNTSIDLSYGNNLKEMSLNLDAGFQNQVYNWYGLPPNFGSSLTAANREILINDIDAKHSYNDFYLGGKLKFKESIFKEMSTKLERFSDNFGSGENRFYIKPTFDIEVLDMKFRTNILVDYTGGSFDKNLFANNIDSFKYGFVNLGLNPNFIINKEDWTISLGVNLFNSSDTVNTNGKFFVYPQVNASLKLVGDLMIFYAGAEGSVEQNSYRNFTNQNPFLSPTLNVAPTDKQYDLFAGLKGKLANSISYNIRGSLVSEKYKPLFKANDYTLISLNTDDYIYGNSFTIVYDDVKTLSFFGEIKADFSKNVTFGINGTFNTFNTNFQEKAWNLPALKINANLDFNITDKWYAGTNLFFVGDRQDQQVNLDLTPIPTDNIKIIASYFDVNAHLGYKYSNRLSGFLKFNNIANQQYQKWLNFPVQGFQALLGANYKFDF